MKYFITFLCWVALQTLSAQPAQTTVDLQKATLAERFQIMKSKSQTYEEYKVVKETVLDGVWKIVMDSLNFRKAQLHESGATIATLENGLRSTQEALKQKEASLQDLIFDGTHISLLGINFGKKTFLVMVVLVTLGLAVLLAGLAGKLKLMHTSVQEKNDLINTTLRELEEYKRKALDKQTKLSRELQNERNKVMELRRT